VRILIFNDILTRGDAPAQFGSLRRLLVDHRREDDGLLREGPSGVMPADPEMPKRIQKYPKLLAEDGHDLRRGTFGLGETVAGRLAQSMRLTVKR
jgi:hypothetical protein